MSDLISRQAAIEAIHEDIDWLATQGGRDLDLPECMERAKSILENLPSAQPEIIRCGQCKYAEAADSEDNQDGYTCQFHRGSIWFSGSYCSWAERREECTP